MHDDAQIAKEITGLLDELIAGYEGLSMDRVEALFSHTPDFRMMNTDGSLSDFETFFKNDADYLGHCARFALTTYANRVSVIDSDTAVLAWSYKAEATLETGERAIVDNAGASFVFVRKDGAWTVAYYHQSSVPFRRVSA